MKLVVPLPMLSPRTTAWTHLASKEKTTTQGNTRTKSIVCYTYWNISTPLNCYSHCYVCAPNLTSADTTNTTNDPLTKTLTLHPVIKMASSLGVSASPTKPTTTSAPVASDPYLASLVFVKVVGVGDTAFAAGTLGVGRTDALSRVRVANVTWSGAWFALCKKDNGAKKKMVGENLPTTRWTLDKEWMGVLIFIWHSTLSLSWHQDLFWAKLP